MTATLLKHVAVKNSGGEGRGRERRWGKWIDWKWCHVCGSQCTCDDYDDDGDDSGSGSSHSTADNPCVVRSYEGKERFALHRPAGGQQTRGRILLQDSRPVATVCPVVELHLIRFYFIRATPTQPDSYKSITFRHPCRAPDPQLLNPTV